MAGPGVPISGKVWAQGPISPLRGTVSPASSRGTELL